MSYFEIVRDGLHSPECGCYVDHHPQCVGGGLSSPALDAIETEFEKLRDERETLIVNVHQAGLRVADALQALAAEIRDDVLADQLAQAEADGHVSRRRHDGTLDEG